MKFFHKNADLVTFTKEILNGKLHFSCSLYFQLRKKHAFIPSFYFLLADQFSYLILLDQSEYISIYSLGLRKDKNQQVCQVDELRVPLTLGIFDIFAVSSTMMYLFINCYPLFTPKNVLRLTDALSNRRTFFNILKFQQYLMI